MNNTPLYASTRAVVGIQVVRGLSAIAGISDNAAIGLDGKDLDIGTGFLQSVLEERHARRCVTTRGCSSACRSDRAGGWAGRRRLSLKSPVCLLYETFIRAQCARRHSPCASE